MTTLAEQMHAQDFDHVWTVVSGQVVDADRNLFAPSVYMFEQEDGSYSEEEVESNEWEPVSAGFTGQYGYNGPVMHASETFGEGMAERLAELSVYYDGFATVAVDCVTLDEDAESEPAGWMVVGHKIG